MGSRHPHVERDGERYLGACTGASTLWHADGRGDSNLLDAVAPGGTLLVERRR
jgi:hypothetical protein